MKKQKMPLLVELERIMAVLGRGIYGRIRIPRFELQVDKKVVLRFVPEEYSVVVGAGFSSLPVMELPVQLLHELVHVHNYSEGIADVTENHYHNRRFVRSALEAGLYVAPGKGWSGWSHTTFEPTRKSSEPTAAALERRAKCVSQLNVALQVVLQGKRTIRNMVEGRGPQRVCFLKYVCDCAGPHNSIRSGRRPDGPHPLRVRCEVCGGLFRCVEINQGKVASQ